MIDLADVVTGLSPRWRPRRRDVLRYVSAAFAANRFSRASTTVAQPAMEFPQKPHQRLAVTSYPFRVYLESPTNRGRNSSLPGMDMTAFPAFVAEQFGVYNVNPLIDHFKSTEPAYLESFRAALLKADSHIVDLGLPGRRFYANSSSVREAAVEFGKKCVDTAVQVGSPSVRQHVDGSKDEKPDISLAAESLGKLAEYGAQQNIVINLENDSQVSEDPFFLAAVIDKVNNPYLRGLPDFGNSLPGHDQDYNRRAVEGMLIRAFNMCHVKDTIEDENGKPCTVDLKSMFELAKATSYRGFFSMEFDTRLGDPIASTRQLVKETLQYLT